MFTNDIRMETRPWRDNFRHFAKKHKDDGLVHATFRHWKAHFEFGSCLLDSRRLRLRYDNLVGLDAVKPNATPLSPSTITSRVRFVQFYTACYKSRVERRLVDHLEQTSSKSLGLSRVGTPRERAKRGATDPEPVANLTEGDQLLFCKLPQQRDGQVDPLWKKVTMFTNDEVVAHTSLFKPGPHYEDLVDQVSAEIVTWVTDDIL